MMRTPDMAKAPGMTKIKICGLMREEDIDAVNAACPDYIGFVFAESRRRIDGDRARQLKAMLDPSIKAVGVFVNEGIGNIIRLCDMDVIDLIQLHGDEDAGYVEELRKHTSKKVIKAFRVRTTEDIARAAAFPCDYVLLDAYQEGKYGGVGQPFDWSLIPGIGRQYFLAGGIGEDNVEEAILKFRPYCVDVSSGAETGGFKDPRKIRSIVGKVRQLGNDRA
ncbi:MAG TPA: phosphoribosylanthranilate isomerase [Clostridia bacterium]